MCYAEDVARNKIKSRVIFSSLAVFFTSVVEYAIFFRNTEAIFAPAEFYSVASAGGFIGSFFGFVLTKLLGHVGVIILSAAILGIYASFFFADRTGKFGEKILLIGETVFGTLATVEGRIKKNAEEKKEAKALQEEEAHILRSDELIADQFFTSVGVENLTVKDAKAADDFAESFEESFTKSINAVQTPPRRRNASKPLDLSYGIEESEIQKAPEEKSESEAASNLEKSESLFSLGLDDSAENVFAGGFDPFNFATDEKLATKPSSKAEIKEEELDELTKLELRGEPTEKEKRRMELEEKKRLWLERRKAEASAAALKNDIATPSTVTDAPIIESVEEAKAEETPETVAQIITSETKSEVNAYSSYASTQTTYTQPIKTVEFTISSDPSVASVAPHGVTDEPAFAPTEDRIDHATEDVAAVIAERIARSNPAYARSANEMITYTRVTHSPEEIAANSPTPMDTLADAVAGMNIFEESAPASSASENSASQIIEFGEEPEGDDYLFPNINKASDTVTTPTEGGESLTFSYGDTVEYNIGSPDTETESASEKPFFDDVIPTENSDGAPAASESFGETAFADSAAEQSPSPMGSNASRSAYQRAAAFAVNAEAVSFEPEVQKVNAQSYGDYTVPATPTAPRPTVQATVDEPSQATANTVVQEAPRALDESAVLESTRTPIPNEAQAEPMPVIDDEAFTVTAEAQESTPKFEPSEFTITFDDEASDAPEAESSASIADDIAWNTNFEETDVTDESQSENGAVDFSDDSRFDMENSEETDEIPEEELAEPVEEIPPEEQNPDVIRMREMFPFLTPIGEQSKAQAPVEETPAAEIPVEPENEDAPPFDIPEKSAPTAVVSMDDVKAEEKKSKKPDYSNYEFPSIELLAKQEAAADENIQAEIQENADKLIETLASFGVSASIKGVDRGPRITRYEVVPAKGVKVSAILNLQDDIALNLAAGSIRMEAPIPGKSAVGIEIPNKKSSIVRLRDLLETEDFCGFKSKTAVCIGRDVAGQPVFGDIAKMPHLLIAGATGMGKSVCINSLMISMLYKARPDEVKFIMIDPKQVEFTMYNGIPHLLVPVVSDAKQAAGALMWAVEEMEKRYNLLNPLCVRNIEAYNEKVAADPSLGEPMSRIVIVIDEFADLMLQVKDPVENLVMRIAQKARAAGIYLIIGTQRPSVNVITGVIKANVPSRISCKVMSNVDSKTVLDSAGAEKLLDRGDALYAPAGSPKPHRVQCAFVADSEVEAIMAHLKKFSDGSNYDSSVMEEIERAAQKCSKKGNGGVGDYDDGDEEIHGEGYLNDRQFLDAVEVAVNTRKISTSLIQRKLSIGYGKAAKFIDIMEDMGIVGEANGQRPREVLITPDEWREKLARATLD